MAIFWLITFSSIHCYVICLSMEPKGILVMLIYNINKKKSLFGFHIIYRKQWVLRCKTGFRPTFTPKNGKYGQKICLQCNLNYIAPHISYIADQGGK